MPEVYEKELTFKFPEGWKIHQPEKWSYYKKQFQSVCGGAKMVDIVAIEPGGTAWFIEVKDYRIHRRTKPIDIANETAEKTRDAIACIFAAKTNASDPHERKASSRLLRHSKIRVVLHLEQPVKSSKLFPRAVDPANVIQKMKQMIKAMDPHPQVVEKSQMRSLPWTVV